MLTGTGVVFGSPSFMSPEQAQGHRVGPPSDVFSLGAVLTFAATGEGPFGTALSATLLYRVVFTPPDVGGLPAVLRPLVERCLAKDPQQRPSTEQLQAELNAATPASGWLPAPITEAFPSHPASEPGPAAPTAVGDLPATPVTQPAAAPRAGVPESKTPTVTPGDMLPLAAAGTEAPGDSRGGGRAGHSHLGLAGAAAAIALIIGYLLVAMTAHLPPFSKASFASSPPAPATTAPALTRPRPSPVATSPATSPRPPGPLPRRPPGPLPRRPPGPLPRRPPGPLPRRPPGPLPRRPPGPLPRRPPGPLPRRPPRRPPGPLPRRPPGPLPRRPPRRPPGFPGDLPGDLPGHFPGDLPGHFRGGIIPAGATIARPATRSPRPMWCSWIRSGTAATIRGIAPRSGLRASTSGGSMMRVLPPTPSSC